MVAGLDYGLGSDTVFLVVGHLLGPSPLRLLDCLTHGVGYLVGIHYHLAVEVSGSASHSLCQRAMRAQEPLLVGIDDRHKRHFGKIETLTEKIDPHEHIVLAGTKPVKDSYAVEGIHIGVDIRRLYIKFLEIVVKLLGHTLGKGSDEHTLVALAPYLYLFQEVVDLMPM